MLNKKIVSLIGAITVSVILFFQLGEGNQLSMINAAEQIPSAEDQYTGKPQQIPSSSLIVPLSTHKNTVVQKPIAPISYVDSLKGIEDKNSFHTALLKDNAQQEKYPPYNQRIPTLEQDPIERRYELDVRTVESENGEASLTLWTDKKYYLQGEDVLISAILQDAKGIRISTQFLGQLIYNETQNLQQFEFSDSDQDGIYEHRFKLDPVNNTALLSGIYKVLIINDANEMVDGVTFILSEPELQLTGNYKDTITSNGNLLIEAEVEVTAKHRFYFQAALYSSTNDPIGSTQFSGELYPGRHWVPLDFDGLMVRDAEEPGPYLLKSVSLAKVVLPMQRAPIIYPEYYTQGYNVDQFRNTNYKVSGSP